MQFKSFAVALVLAASTLGVHAADSEFPAELRVARLSKPSDCSRISKKGDTLRMHYSGQLDNGVKFDSSYDR